MHLAAIAALCFISLHAYADQTADTIKAFGLDGTFADNCSVPVSQQTRTNLWYIDSSGRMTITTLINGNQPFPTGVIAAASRLSDTRLEIQVPQPAGNVTTILEKEGQDYRTIHSQDASGKVIADNGIIVASGQRLPVMSPCQEEAVTTPSTTTPQQICDFNDRGQQIRDSYNKQIASETNPLKKTDLGAQEDDALKVYDKEFKTHYGLIQNKYTIFSTFTGIVTNFYANRLGIDISVHVSCSNSPGLDLQFSFNDSKTFNATPLAPNRAVLETLSKGDTVTFHAVYFPGWMSPGNTFQITNLHKGS